MKKIILFSVLQLFLSLSAYAETSYTFVSGNFFDSPDGLIVELVFLNPLSPSTVYKSPPTDTIKAQIRVASANCQDCFVPVDIFEVTTDSQAQIQSWNFWGQKTENGIYSQMYSVNELGKVNGVSRHIAYDQATVSHENGGNTLYAQRSPDLAIGTWVVHGTSRFKFKDNNPDRRN